MFITNTTVPNFGDRRFRLVDGRQKPRFLRLFVNNDRGYTVQNPQSNKDATTNRQFLSFSIPDIGFAKIMEKINNAKFKIAELDTTASSATPPSVPTNEKRLKLMAQFKQKFSL